MLWRLSHSSPLQTYLHGENPCSIVMYDQASEELCSALCGRLLSCGLDLILVALSSVHTGSFMHKHLQAAYPKKNITFITLLVEDADRSMRILSDAAKSRDISIFVNLVKPHLQTSGTHRESPAKIEYSIQLFDDMQKVVLPHLVSHAPSVMIIAANSLSPSLEEDSEYFKSFVVSLSGQLHLHGYKETKVMFMEYIDIENRTHTNSLLCPSPEVLSESILNALGRNSPHVIPYWFHELYAWVIFILLLVLPPSLVAKLAPV